MKRASRRVRILLRSSPGRRTFARGALRCAMGACVATLTCAVMAADLAITVDRGGEAEVVESRRITLSPPRTPVRWERISPRLDQETVQFSVPGGVPPLLCSGLRMEHDAQNRDSLLLRYVDKPVEIVRPETDERVKGTVLAVERGQISQLRTDGGELWLNPRGEVLLPREDSLVMKPTLTCEIVSSPTDARSVQLSYRTTGLPWSVSYGLTFDEEEATADLTATMLLRNDTGVDFEEASWRFVAVEKQRIEGMQPVEQERLIEYHPPTLGPTASLLARETLRMQLLEARGVPVEVELVFDPLTAGPAVSVPEQTLAQIIRIPNTKRAGAVGLGTPLPSGRLKLRRRHPSGVVQPLGDRSIGFTDTDEDLEIPLGASLGVMGKRSQTPFTEIPEERVQEQEVRILLRNTTDTEVQARVVERPWGKWEIPSSSDEFKKVDKDKVEFLKLIPAKGQAEIVYALRIAY